MPPFSKEEIKLILSSLGLRDDEWNIEFVKDLREQGYTATQINNLGKDGFTKLRLIALDERKPPSLGDRAGSLADKELELSRKIGKFDPGAIPGAAGGAVGSVGSAAGAIAGEVGDVFRNAGGAALNLGKLIGAPTAWAGQQQKKALQAGLGTLGSFGGSGSSGEPGISWSDKYPFLDEEDLQAIRKLEAEGQTPAQIDAFVRRLYSTDVQRPTPEQDAAALAAGDYDPETLLAIGIIPRGNTGIYYDETTGFEGPLQEVFAARRDYLATKLRGSGGGTRFQPQLGVDPDGREYIWDPNTQTKNYTGNTFDPTRQTTSIYDDTTGYTSLIDAQTGEIISSFQTGYAGLDPQEKFAADEAYRSATLRADAEARRGQFEIQSAQLLQQALANRRQQELEAQRQVAEILRNPSDYISAAFLQRGKPAPSATVTHADLINRLYEQTGTGQPKSFATGGATTAGKFMVGDKPNRTTGAEEIILNPTNAPITVIPANGSFTGPRFAAGTYGWLAALEKANEEYAGRAANPSGTIPSLTVGRGPEHQFSNVTPEQAAAVANFFGAKPAPTASTSPVNPTVTQTTPAFDWEKYYEMERADRRAFLEEFRNIFNRPLGQPTSQSELVSQAQTNSPPAVSALLSGQRQDPLRFKFPLFSPRQLGQLTPNELKALSSRLGVGFNTSLDDVRAAQEQRYGGSFYPKARFLRG